MTVRRQRTITKEEQKERIKESGINKRNIRRVKGELPTCGRRPC